MKKLVVGGLLAAGAAYLFDPRGGARRRSVAIDRVRGLSRWHARRLARSSRAVTAQAYGVMQGARHRHEEPKDYDDATLARKVESEIFRDADAPKGAVVVNAQEGVVQLRGEVERPELIEQLVEKTRSVQGVRSVKSLLHLPGTPTPMHE